MARNSISYEGRMIASDLEKHIKFGRYKADGQTVLQVTIAEQHQGKNGRVAKKYQDATKGTDDWVNTTTSWHRLTVFGELAETLAQDPNFNHGAILKVTNASYTEEDPWTTKDNVQRAGRPETIGKDGSLAIHEYNGRVFGAYTDDNDNLPEPIWDGISEIPTLQTGGGQARGREYGENEGL